MYDKPMDFAPSAGSIFPSSDNVIKTYTKSPAIPTTTPATAMALFSAGAGHASHLSPKPECENVSAHAEQRKLLLL
jgi:hypothetical protein